MIIRIRGLSRARRSRNMRPEEEHREFEVEATHRCLVVMLVDESAERENPSEYL